MGGHGNPPSYAGAQRNTTPAGAAARRLGRPPHPGQGTGGTGGAPPPPPRLLPPLGLGGRTGPLVSGLCPFFAPFRHVASARLWGTAAAIPGPSRPAVWQ